jgi:hypothetical protein
MSLQDDFDDYYFESRSRRSKRPLILLLVISISLLLLCTAATVAVLVARGQAISRAEEARAAQQAAAIRQALGAAQPLFTRDDFEKVVKGQHSQDLVAAIGRPDEKTVEANGNDGPTQR